MNIIKSIKLLVIACALFLAISCTAYAAPTYDLPVDGNWSSVGTISEDDTVEYYKVVLPADGKLEITLQSWIQDVGYKFWDADLTKSYVDTSLGGGTLDQPVSSVITSMYLTKGTYNIGIYKHSSWGTPHTGEYKLKAVFINGNVTETEPNNTPAQAPNLAVEEEITALLWVDDEYDYYKTVVKPGQSLKIRLTSYLWRFEAGIRDENLQEVKDLSGDPVQNVVIEGGKENEPVVKDLEYNVAPGTYLIFVKESFSWGTPYTGIYRFKLMDGTADVIATPSPTPTPTPTAVPAPTNTPTPLPTGTPTPIPTPVPATPYDNYTGQGLKPLTVSTSTMNTTITTSKSEEISGASYPLLQARAINVGTSSFRFKWNKITGATKYVVYGNKCGKRNKYEFLQETTKTFYKPRKLKKNSYYKFIVVAVKDDKVISVSKTVHVGLKPQQNPTRVKVNKNKITLKKTGAGSTFKIRTKVVGTSVKQHRAVKFETDNVNVAKVSNRGIVTAIGQGTCNIYAYAQNGISAKITVTVLQ